MPTRPWTDADRVEACGRCYHVRAAGGGQLICTKRPPHLREIGQMLHAVWPPVFAWMSCGEFVSKPDLVIVSGEASEEESTCH